MTDRDYFVADFGPTVTERQTLFLSSTELLRVERPVVALRHDPDLHSAGEHVERRAPEPANAGGLLQAASRRTPHPAQSGQPYIAEGANPDTGSWEGHDSYNHSEHYFHSGYNDLIVTGLVGLRPRTDDVIEVNPLAPDGWALLRAR